MPVVIRTALGGRIAIATAFAVAACSKRESSEEPPTPKLEIVCTPEGRPFQRTTTVTLTTDTGAAIYFTTDGSNPDISSARYTEPVVVTESTRIRAVAIEKSSSDESVSPPGSAGSGGGNVESSAGSAGSLRNCRRGPVKTCSFLRVSEDVADYSTHLPIVLIHTFESGAIDPSSNEFVAATMQVIEPTDGSAKLLGPAALDARIGIHVRGSSSRDFSKKSYAVEFWKETSNSDTPRPLLGMPADSDFIFSDPIEYDRTFIRNALAYALSNRIGRYAPRTRFVEVFLATGKADLSKGRYLGLYTTIERLKRGQSRIDVKRLLRSTDDVDLSGGYILKIDKGTKDFSAAGRDWQFVYPKSLEMRQLYGSTHLEYVSGFIDAFGRAMAAEDLVDPESGQSYSELIDVDSFIDHNIINALLKNVDAFRFSSYFSKDRNGRLVAGPVWDFDRSSGTPYERRAVDPEEWSMDGSDAAAYLTYGWYGRLLAEPSFKRRYIERFRSLLTGEFTPERIDATIDRLVLELGTAAARNLARWPDSPPKDGSYQAELDVLKTFLRRRVDFIRHELDAGL